MALLAATALLFLDLLPLGTYSYSWNFGSTPAQCSNLTISITGSGKPPYELLVIPSGPTPFDNGTEVRRISSQQFSGSSVTFKLNYPAQSQFVAVVSDSSGFGSGGTSAAAEVTSSSDSSCIDASQPVSPDWTFHIDPQSQIVQCQATRLWWAANNVTGTPSFFGVIPGGDSFIIPENNINTTSDTGTGFSWTPNIRDGTTLHIVANDGRGNGTGGSSRTTVGTNQQNDNSCLNSNSPSSTAGSPAGGSYPTNTSGDSTGGGSSSGGSSTNVGAIVGGVVGGVFGLIALLLVLWFIRRRSKNTKGQKEKPVDLLQGDEGDERPARRTELPEYYQPEPFVVPDPNVADSSVTDSDGRPLSRSDRPSSRSGTPDVASTSTGTRKNGAPAPLRAVNIMQHEDAGPSEAGPKEAAETIELPPAYTNIRK